MSSAPSRPSHQMAVARPLAALQDVDSANQMSPSRPHKRVKASASVESSSQVVATGERGGKSLKRLFDIPFDVQLEILSHLRVSDLLNMCRLERLRPILMSDSTKSAWRKALEGVPGLPPILEGLNEPQYAELVFDKRCHHCLNVTDYIQWAIRMRLCRTCLFDSTIMTTENALRFQNLGDPTKVRDLLTITPHYDIPDETDHRLYHWGSLRRLIQESAALRRGTSQYTTWFSQKQEEHKDLVQSYEQHEIWWISITTIRPAEGVKCMKLRHHSIVDKLKADGWAAELKLPQTAGALVDGHPLVRQSRILIAREWEAMRPTLTAILSEIRADELKRKWQRAISERTSVLEKLCSSLFTTLPETPRNPPASALCLYQPFLDIINNTPPAEDATAALTKALDNVPAICEKWRQEQETHLKALLRNLGRSEDLSLVVNGFTCSITDHKCIQPHSIFHYPYYAGHRCFFSTAVVGHDIIVEVWSNEAVTAINQIQYDHCVSILKMCRLNPATATAEDMDGADVFFRCELCDSGRKSVNGLKAFRLMRWRTAMNHQHAEKVRRVVDAELLALGRRQEKRVLEKELEYDFQAAVCVHCNVEVYARAEHLRSAHGMDGDFEAVDHYRRGLRYMGLNGLKVQVWRQDGDKVKN